jgi:hypothetical protein
MQTQQIKRVQTQKKLRLDLESLRPQLDYLLGLARLARLANELGIQDEAIRLRKKHDCWYEELRESLPRE